MSVPLAKFLSEVVAGKRTDLVALRRVSHLELRQAEKQLPPLVLTRRAVLDVLEAWMAGRLSKEEVQVWASFVRRGYLSTGREPIEPLTIEYELGGDGIISSVLSRLDEIGDAVDGEIDTAEQEELLAVLRGSSL